MSVLVIDHFGEGIGVVVYFIKQVFVKANDSLVVLIVWVAEAKVCLIILILAQVPNLIVYYPLIKSEVLVSLLGDFV